MLPNPLHFHQICRICLSSSDKLINLFDSEENILNLLVTMTALSVSTDDNLPQNICPFCCHQIKTTQYFILKCQESDEKLRLSLDAAGNNVKDERILDDDRILNETIEFDQTEDEEAIDGRVQSSNSRESNEISGPMEENFEPAASEESIPQPTQKPQNLCLICNKTFAQPKNLVRHRLIHEKNKNKESDFQYTICGKRMTHVNNFKIHMRSHRDFSGNLNIPVSVASECKKQFLCSICGRACTSWSNLAVHTRRHNGTMTNFCKICGKGYPRSTDLTVHMRQHTGEKPFVCLTCNRGFTRSDKLTIHIRTHTGERPYSCTGCTKSFAQRNDLITHQRRNVCGSKITNKQTEAAIRNAAK